MQDKALELVVIAKELRHPLPFKDCLILCLGPWQDPKASKITDPQIKRAATNGVNEIGTEIAHTQARIILSMSYEQPATNMGTALGVGELEAAKGLRSTHLSCSTICLPCYYRNLENAKTGPCQERLRNLIEPLWGRISVSSMPKTLNKRECYFLGVQIRDEEFPWV